MFYPDDFKERVKKIYPKSTALHHYLDSGEGSFVGALLRSETPVGIPFAQVLDAKYLEELQDIAKKGLEKEALYEEWQLLYRAWVHDHPEDLPVTF